MACDTTIAAARRRLTVKFEEAIRQTGESFQALAHTLLDDNLEAETRAQTLFGEEGRAVWAGVFNSSVAVMQKTSESFEEIVKGTAQGGAVIEKIYMDADNWQGEKDPDKLENLRGKWAEVIKYLKLAGFDLKVIPVNGICFQLQVSR